MLKFFFTAVILTVSSIIFTGCGPEAVSLKDIGSKKLLRYYSASRFKSGDTRVSAHFYANGVVTAGDQTPKGTPVKLNGISAVSCNGIPLVYEKNPLGGEFYTAVFDKWAKSFTFEWIDGSGDKHTDTEVMDTIDFSANWLARSGIEQTVVWKGSPVMAGETVTFRDNSEGNKRHWESSEQGSRSIVLTGSSRILPLLPVVELQRRLIIKKGDFPEYKPAEGVMISLTYSTVK